ncbi:serine/threonine-protein kinase cot-1 [Mytilinidion resinicola]|uniref:non-specific serine/threonine protein kinase n=1 Tax=Mytilinidion resinicola TaxID=574789 RepID=A0A6A6YXY2_9PEZI|nr:serine/threonine-protein kinase cot-1 [Mytilinidion resinicola]KAF2813359.1 serine/threonine-protein kinase cot-1 [Mytilinidion resinicola]
MNNNNNNPPNRLQLNFGFSDRNNNNANYAADAGRAYPTTPSTFPQPVFPNQAGQQEVWGTQQPNNGYAPGYFAPPTAAYSAGYQQQQGNLQAPSAAYRAPQYNDGTNGLVHQFSHQNLGGGRSASPYSRQPSPSQRPRTAGATGQQYSSYLNSQMPNAPRLPSLYDEEPPAKSAEKYSENVLRQAKVSVGLVSTFFKDSVQRARDRNQRSLDLDGIKSNPSISESRKAQRERDMRRAEAEYLRFLRTKEKPENFSTLKIIGKGAFGEVKLVQRKNDGKIYALKSLVKSEMFKKDQLAHVRSERDILAESDSPWVVKLHTTFQDNTFLYMLMEFLPGGDLMTMLIKYEIFTEDITRFYMAEITLAIEAVHKLGFIHRDIKPDNILLDRGGHIKLTDFGLSTGFHKEHEAGYYKKLLAGGTHKSNRDNRNSMNLDQIQLTVSNRSQINTWRKSRRQLAYSTVGTPDYIAPEIFSGQGYDYSCDWWSVGTIMFECLIGWPPFCAEEPHDTYRKIVDWPRNLHFPPDQQLGPEAEDFVKRLICDADNRLGRMGGAHEIKQHPFFRGVQWDGLRRIRAPFEPKLSSNVDTQYFPIDEIDQNDNSAALRAQTAQAGDDLAAEMSLPFIGYTYKRFDAFRGS